MDSWFVSPEMKSLAGTEVRTFGYDLTGKVKYQLNNLGFRSPELQNQASVIAIGNSITFGVGLDNTDTFVYQIAKQLGIPYANFAIGCHRHENHDHLVNLSKLVGRDTDDLFVVQINNLDRRRVDQQVVCDNDSAWCIARAVDYFDQVRELTKHKRRLFVYWDNIKYDLPKSIEKELLIYNKFHLDTSVPNYPNTFGAKSHRAIGKVISTYLTTQTIHKV